MTEKTERPGCERIDHCSGCGGEFGPQQADSCPVCKPGPGLISTWGEAQAERYRSGERYTTPAGERDQEMGPNFTEDAAR